MDARGATRTRSGRRFRRAARATLVSSALIVLTLAGHTAASGALPDVPALALTALIATALTAAVSERRMTLPAMLAYLVGAEALLHVVLAVAGHGHGSLLPSASMITAHLMAAVGSALVLVEAERILDRWLVLLRRALGSAFPALRPIPAPLTGAVVTGPLTSTLLTLLHARELRGPPAAARPRLS